MRSCVLLTAGCLWMLITAGLTAETGFTASPSDSDKPLLAGTAVVDITPPVGYRVSGYFYERAGTGVHDPLYAKAMAFAQGDIRAVLVVCDLIGIPATVADPARRRASERTGIPISHLAIAATHTHTGPLFFGALRTYLHEAAVARHGSDPREEFDYPAFLIDRLVEAIVQATTAVRPVRLQAGVARQDPPLSFHRRFYMKDGSVRFNPGFLNPEIVKPCGPIDPEVGILLLRDPRGGKPLASLTVFANHLDTTGGTEFSADYPAYLSLKLKEHLGDDHVSVFGQGTSGNINHLDVSKPREQGARSARQIGTLLGETVLAALPRLPSISESSLAVVSHKVELPVQRSSPEQIRAAREAMLHYTRPEPAQTGENQKSAEAGDKKAPKPADTFLSKVEACKIADVAESWGPTASLEVQVFRISKDVAVVALPGEVFVELGLAIKKSSPFRTTLVLELCNAHPYYIPTEKGFAEGAYEAINSRLQPGGGEKLATTAIRLLKQMAVTATVPSDGS